MAQDPRPGAGPGERGYEFEAAEASFDLLVQEGAGPVPAEVRAAGLPRQHRDRRATASRSPRRRSRSASATQVEHTVSEGDGPVNALDGALRKALQPRLPAAGGDAAGRLQGARRQRPAGTAARVRVVIESRDGDDVWGTVGVSENIIEASWLALVDSFEYKLFKDEETQLRRRIDHEHGHANRERTVDAGHAAGRPVRITAGATLTATVPDGTRNHVADSADRWRMCCIPQEGDHDRGNAVCTTCIRSYLTSVFRVSHGATTREHWCLSRYRRLLGRSGAASITRPDICVIFGVRSGSRELADVSTSRMRDMAAC